jgi:hypothetical protein
VLSCIDVLLLLPQVDMEYLKNLVLQLYTTGEAEALLPVFAALLAFGPSEMQRCKQVRAAAAAAAAVDVVMA